MSADYVRTFYGVPAKRGQRVIFNGKPGRIVSFPGARIGVRFDDQPKYTLPCHPTWEIVYLDRDGNAVADYREKSNQ